ncbi:potassium uptake protein [Cladophialophora psammophila CBS 110553]|uniref:Potassium uptake protein n=1 Tax=Cladophialophora psammophila CBS 110553 TaxID=1182543 RepID=W9XH83_9EURO|nr:potassium uptake protein [Cladophialophora psammophila CBS 110553]EXJ76710.1 potassium uptake protein [Cladophialophora psammophila CBS 110553]
MATIRIADEIHPKNELQSKEGRPADSTSIYTHDDGIYNMRSRRSSHDLTLYRSRSLQQDEDPGLRKEGDFKEKQVFSGKMLLWLAYQSIGVIYGDIGTSPLYVYSSTFTSAPSNEDLIGVLSLIIWSLIMMVTVKYIIIVLHADNEGEGGTFSTYSLLSRYMNITNRDPREASLIRIKRHASGDLENAGRVMRKGLESSRLARGLLKTVGVLAVSMVLSDGVLTPAQSVLGAVQGARVVNPSISKGAIIGITDAILVLLFLIQPFGITKITFAFSPIVIIWLGFNAVFGIYNLAKYDASVFRAFNPGYAFEFLIHHGEHGWRMLGGVLLAFTGVEALFADLGAFSRRAIQLSWLCYTFPCLLLAYIGQAAYISVHPEAYSNPFFEAAPPGTIYPSLIIAILAAIVASQAIITATFQLLHQVMKLSYFPQLTVKHTSKIFHGQLYIPLANWLLMIGTILVASIYNNTTSLGNAYGVCVMFVTFFDTCMVSLTAIFVWRFSPFLVFLPWLTIACLDGTFLSSALTKVPDGAWFTLTLAFVLGMVFMLWRFGKEQQWVVEAEDRFPTSHFIKKGPDGLHLTERFHGTALSTINGFGIFFDKGGETTPIVFSQFAIKLTAMPEVSVFFHLRPLETPSVPPSDRHTVSKLAIPHCYRLVVRYGYNDEVMTPDLSFVIYEQIRAYILSEQKVKSQMNADPALVSDECAVEDAATTCSETGTGTETDEKFQFSRKVRLQQDHDLEKRTEALLARLDRAFGYKVMYIMGKEQLTIKNGTNYFRRTLLSLFLWMKDNTRTKMSNLAVPTEKLIEVGFLKEI